MADEKDHPLTIEQLASESGLTVRNIRSHQARGLLPPPVVRRRTGYYGDEHLERLRVIGELQAEGLELKAVKQLLEDADGTVERLLNLRRSLPEPVAPEPREVVTEAELAERLSPKLIRKLEEHRYIAPIASGHYEVTSPALLDALEKLLLLGLKPPHVVDLVGSIHDHTGTVARRLTRSFLDDVWKPFAAEDTPEERWPDIADAISRLPGLGAGALRSAFLDEIRRELDRALDKAAQELSQRKR